MSYDDIGSAESSAVLLVTFVAPRNGGAAARAPYYAHRWCDIRARDIKRFLYLANQYGSVHHPYVVGDVVMFFSLRADVVAGRAR